MVPTNGRIYTVYLSWIASQYRCMTFTFVFYDANYSASYNSCNLRNGQLCLDRFVSSVFVVTLKISRRNVTKNVLLFPPALSTGPFNQAITSHMLLTNPTDTSFVGMFEKQQKLQFTTHTHTSIPIVLCVFDGFGPSFAVNYVCCWLHALCVSNNGTILYFPHRDILDL